jgi:monoamine oxidase
MAEEIATTHRQVDVVIVGAGASGLQCASSLLRSEIGKDFSILVLEARNRMGGRVLTTHETRTATKKSDNTSSVRSEVSFFRDHGASWVHGTGVENGEKRNPMVRLLEEITPTDKCAIDEHLYPVFPGNAWTRPDTALHKTQSIAIYVDGKLIPNESKLVSQAIHRHYDLQKKVAAHANHLFEIGEGMQTVHISVEQVRLDMLEKGGNGGVSTEESEMVEKLFPFYNFLKENWDGASSNDMQVSSVDAGEQSMQTDEVYNHEGDFEGPHCKVKSGMATVLQPLVARVEKHVRLNQQVSRIKDMNDHVQVETASGLTVDAKCCVSTMPLGCLQKCAEAVFEPALGLDKLEGIRSLSSGAYKKVFLTFDRIFWPATEPLIGLVRDNSKADDLGKYLLVNNLWQKDDIPCLEAILCGDLGKWAINRSDEDIKNAVIVFFQEAMAMPNLREYCTNCHITRWEEDAFTQGSYSSFRLGTLERHVETFSDAEWNGRLIFAGEHTESEHMGSVHAALMSGNRAAGDVLELLSKKAMDS